MLQGGQLLDCIKATMVVGEQQAFRGNHFTGASAIKLADRVFQAGLVGVVNGVGVEFTSEGFHLFFVQLFELGGQPHTTLCA
jgi:hypothetical protein